MEYFRVASIIGLLSWLGFAASCDVTDVAVYRVLQRASWTEGRFPQDYPKVWPKAQWSQLFGQSHNSSYFLLRVGEFARESVARLAHFGRLDQLMEEGDADPRIYDQFTADAVPNGDGETAGLVMVDGSHHLVSAITRLVPPADWFVGVDSVDLCVDGGWIEEITLDLRPLTAGGPAPGWGPPRAPVARLGPPAAGSARYPREPPPVATLQFVKMKEYSAKELNQLAREKMASVLQPTITKEPRTQTKNVDVTKQTIGQAFNDVIEQKTSALLDLEEDPVGTPRPGNPDDEVVVVTASDRAARPRPTDHHRDHDRDRDYDRDRAPTGMDAAVLAVARGRLPHGGRLPRHFRSRLHHAVNRLTSEDCLVSSWSPWSPCSVSCGAGARSRRRTVVNAPTSTGRACPETQERESCGQPCSDMEYFDW